MKNLYLLKTDKHIKNVGDLVKDKYGDIHIFTKKDSKEYGKTIAKLNIYITSDEYIGLSYYLDGNLIRKGVVDDKDYWEVRKDYKKIILTTDQDLIKDGVQAIDDEFLEWFVKNPSCEKVEIEKLPYDGTKSITKYWDGEYKIIIPKEEPKQETLKEVVKVERTELFNSIFSVVKQIPRKDVNGDAIDAISCAYEIEQLFYKWQQEQDKKCY
jgi:hypothetical protein